MRITTEWIVCPWPDCRHALGGSVIEDAPRPPAAGDVAVCIYCCRLMAYVDDKIVRRGDLRDIDDPGVRTRVMLALAAIRAVCPMCKRTIGACIDAGECKRTKPPPRS